MEELDELQKKRRVRIAVCMCAISCCLMLIGVGRRHLWVTFLCIGVETVMLVLMLREVMEMQRGR